MATRDQAGQKIDCPRCQHTLLVPGYSPAPDDKVSVDDLIDFNDDIMNPGQAAEEITAEAVKETVEAAKEPLVPVVGGDRNDGEIPLAVAPEPPADPIVEAETPAQDDSPVELLDEPDDDLDDLLPLPDPAAAVTAAGNKDPFEYDEDADLRIEGITPQDNQFSIVCPLCATMIYARVSQIGTQLKCPDCYSLVDVEEPDEIPEPGEFDVPDDPDGDAGFRLSEPVELPAIDTTIDQTLGDIDYDDDEFFARRREMQDEQSDNVEIVQPESRADAGYGLAPPEEDLLKPQVSLPTFDNPQAEAMPADRTQPGPAYEDAARSVDPTVRPEDVPARVEPDPTMRASSGKAGEDIPGWFSNCGTWLGECLTPFREMHSLIRLALFTLLMGTAYLIISAGAGWFTEEANQLQMFMGFGIMAFGGIMLVLILMMVGITGNAIVRVSLERRGSMGEWPDFSLADLLSQFLYLGTSFWVAAVPGLIVGQVVWLSTNNAGLMFFITVSSSLMLAPIFLSSVVYNESPWQIFSPEVLGSLGTLKNRWIRFFLAAILISALLAVSLYGVLFGPLGFVIALLQLSLLFIYYWMLGDLVHHIVDWMVRRSESATA